MKSVLPALTFTTRWMAIFLGLWHLYVVSGFASYSTLEVRITHLTVMLVLIFLVLAERRIQRLPEGTQPSVLLLAMDLILAVLAGGTGYYLFSRWLDIAMSGGITTPTDAIVGMMVIVLVMIAVVRRIGWFLAGIIIVFLGYPLVSPWLPGVFTSRGYSFQRIAEFMTTSSEGIYGIPLGVSATFIIMFSIFGSFLNTFGAGDFFFQISSRATKGAKAASAKTAVVFSTLLGMISGSAAGNVAVTGTMTIPMMKREGYKPHQAAAIEAVVSTGGQIMPPVMGAAAFIMAEIIGVPYSSIMVAALIPAILFFTSIFFMVHLQGESLGIEPLPQTEAEPPLMSIILPGLRFIIPFVLLVSLMISGYSPFKSSFTALGVLLVGCVLFELKDLRGFVIKCCDALEAGTKSVMSIAVACAGAGMIAGILAMTGLGSKVSGLIIVASGGVPLIALILTMFVSIILGMGLPTTAAYLILATVVAPALVEMGVPVLTAHLFVFFYGCISTITPPVALASYVAAGIAGSDINKTSWTAFAYGITSYILPFMFFFGPALLMQGTAPEIVVAVVTGLLSVFCFSVAIVGYFMRKLNIGLRVTFAVTGLVMMYQSWLSDAVGVAIFAGLVLLLKAGVASRSSRKA